MCCVSWQPWGCEDFGLIYKLDYKDMNYGSSKFDEKFRNIMKTLSKGRLKIRQSNYNDIPKYKVEIQKYTMHQIVTWLET